MDIPLVGPYAVAAVVLVIASLFAWLSYLVLCGWIVHKTGTTAGLRDLATAARAYRQPRLHIFRRDRAQREE